MPLYGYACAACGPFAATRPMADYRAPAPCPVCGADADRAVSVPALLGRTARRAPVDPSARSEDTASYRRLQPHGRRCACCAG